MKISVVIPVKNKEEKRLKIVIGRVLPYVDEVIVVDYGSTVPVVYEHEQVKVIRYDGDIWNKPHAINIGFTKSSNDYIMTLDADILLPPDFFHNIIHLLGRKSFIYGDNVLRLKIEDYDENSWDNCLNNTKPWRKNKNIQEEFFNTATGGFQIFHRDWFNEIKMLDENLIYYGGMDNITLVEARRSGLNMIKLTKPIIHIDHEKTKEDNLSEDEKAFALFVRKDRWELIDYILNDPGYFKEVGGSLEGPKDTLTARYRKLYEEYKVEGRKDLILDINPQTKILICVINNKGFLPERFVKSLISLFMTTKRQLPNTDLKFIRACQVNNMRNMAITCAIEEKFDYVVQLDDDHFYPEYFILKLLSHKKDFVTGCTRQRVHPFFPTQFKEYKIPIKTVDNMVFSKGEDKIEKIGCSGPVGMLIKVSAVKDFTYPYYDIDYSPRINGIPAPIGGDFYFCKKIIDSGNELYLDHSLDFPHFIFGEVSAISKDDNPRVKLNDGSL
jgi:glycosyltransferase involved in cell wall biosynthesis